MDAGTVGQLSDCAAPAPVREGKNGGSQERRFWLQSKSKKVVAGLMGHL